MKKGEVLAIALTLMATVGTVVAIFAAEYFMNSQQYTVDLLAREPDKGNWYPREITVPFGEEVRIRIRNVETVTHGFAMPDFDIEVSKISPGQVEIVTFTADKKGTFPFMCTVWCSDRHMEMNGTLIVE